jgi:hypothetical protein
LKSTIQILILTFLIGSCHSDKTINVFSKDIKDQKEKEEILNKYLNKHSRVLDSEYYIKYQDNGGGLVPGPSDYYISVALKLQPDSIYNWVSHLEPTTPFKTDDWEGLSLNPKSWELIGKTKYYRSSLGTELKVVYTEQNIILAQYSTMPINVQYVK